MTMESRCATISTKITGIAWITPAQSPAEPSTTTMRLLVREDCKFSFYARLSDITLGMARESKDPSTGPENTANLTSWCQFGGSFFWFSALVTLTDDLYTLLALIKCNYLLNFSTPPFATHPNFIPKGLPKDNWKSRSVLFAHSTLAWQTCREIFISETSGLLRLLLSRCERESPADPSCA